mgnify:FL=1
MNLEFKKYRTKLKAIKNMMALQHSTNHEIVDAITLVNQFRKTEEEFYDFVEKDPDQDLGFELKNKLNKMFEWKSLKKIIPDTSYIERKTASENILKLSDEIQEEIMYDPSAYFESYFLNNSNNASITGVDDIKGNPITRSKSFRNWFADSILYTTTPFTPTIYYHGTRSRYEKYSFDMFPGMYFGKNKAYSKFFAEPNGIISDVYLKVTNPIDLEFFGTEKVPYNEFVGYIELKYGYKLQKIERLQKVSDKENGILIWVYLRNAIEWLKQIISDNVYDAILFEENNPSVDENSDAYKTPAVMVFKPNQIKSVKGNFLYSSQSDDVRFESGGVVEDSENEFESIEKSDQENIKEAQGIFGLNFAMLDEIKQDEILNSISRK